MATSSPPDFGILLGLAYQGFVDQLHVDLAGRGFTDLGPAFGYVVRAIAGHPITTAAELLAAIRNLRVGVTRVVAGGIPAADPRTAEDPRSHCEGRQVGGPGAESSGGRVSNRGWSPHGTGPPRVAG